MGAWGRVRKWRERNEARSEPNAMAWIGIGVLYLVTALGGAVFLSTMHGPGHVSVPMWVWWILVAQWLGLAAISFARAKRDHARLPR